MPKAWKILCHSVCILFFVPFVLMGPARADNLPLVADIWCPYNCDPAADKPGYVVEMSRKVWQQAGHEVDYFTLPWKRVLTGLEKGTYFGGIGAIPDEMPDAVYPAEPIGTSTTAIVKRYDDPWVFTDLQSLKGREVGIIDGYFYGEAMEAWLAEHGRVQVQSGINSLDTNIRKLIHNRIDVVVDDMNVVKYKINMMNLHHKLAKPYSFEEGYYIYVALSPKWPNVQELAAQYTAGVRRLRESGELQIILEAYGLDDWHGQGIVSEVLQTKKAL